MLDSNRFVMWGWLRRIVGRGRLEDYANKPSKSIERKILQATEDGKLVWLLVANGRGSGSYFVPRSDIKADDVNVQDADSAVVHIPRSAIKVRHLLLSITQRHIDLAVVDMSTGTPRPDKNFSDIGGASN